MTDSWFGGGTRPDGMEPEELVPLFMRVKGRASPRNSKLDLATQVRAVPAANASVLDLKYQEILARCRSQWMSIAEISAYLHSPLTITKLMVDVLVEEGFLRIGTPAQQQEVERDLLERVLAGLQRL